LTGDGRNDWASGGGGVYEILALDRTVLPVSKKVEKGNTKGKGTKRAGEKEELRS